MITLKMSLWQNVLNGLRRKTQRHALVILETVGVDNIRNQTKKCNFLSKEIPLLGHLIRTAGLKSYNDTFSLCKGR